MKLERFTSIIVERGLKKISVVLLSAYRGSQHGCPAFENKWKGKEQRYHPVPAALLLRAVSGQLPASVWKCPPLQVSHRLFSQSPNMVLKCIDGNPVLYAPLMVGKPAGSALRDPFQPEAVI